MNRKGETHINIIGLLFIVLIVLIILGKTSFWHILLFPFYVIGGFIALILGIVLLVGVALGILYLVLYLLDK